MPSPIGFRWKGRDIGLKNFATQNALNILLLNSTERLYNTKTAIVVKNPFCVCSFMRGSIEFMSAILQIFP